MNDFGVVFPANRVIIESSKNNRIDFYCRLRDAFDGRNPANHLWCVKPVVNNGINMEKLPFPQLVFTPDFWTISSMKSLPLLPFSCRCNSTLPQGVGQYPPALHKLISKRRNFAQIEAQHGSTWCPCLEMLHGSKEVNYDLRNFMRFCESSRAQHDPMFIHFGVFICVHVNCDVYL